MRYDYDVVILGGSDGGRRLAQQGVTHGKRVALVAGWDSTDHDRRAADFSHRTLVQAAQSRQGQARHGWAIASPPPLPTIQAWGRQAADGPDFPLAELAALGVDVVPEPGSFCPHPLTVQTPRRQLRSRAYVLATGMEPAPLPLPGLETVEHWTPVSLWQSSLPSTPVHWLVVGGGAQTVELAQALTWIGHRVTLVAPQLLPAEDPDLTALLAAHMQAEGLQIVTGMPTQVRATGATLSLSVNGREYPGDRLVIEGQRPQVRSLNLEGVGLSITSAGIAVNAHLQTTHPRIFALGDLLGGYALPAVTAAEVAALNHTFTRRRRPVPYPAIPITIDTSPPITRLGLTESQARQRMGDVWVALDPHPKAVDCRQGFPTGWLKVILTPQGQILGVSGLGHREAIATLALPLLHRQSLHRLDPLAPPLEAIAHLWDSQRPKGLRRWL
jgi:pyruvate/2-oxoglutarate dehydrogenase complex dihydrolipoamide dehydrogenase (E3) component